MACEQTHLHAGARAPRETIEKPEARTPSDWNQPARNRSPVGIAKWPKDHLASAQCLSDSRCTVVDVQSNVEHQESAPFNCTACRILPSELLECAHEAEMTYVRKKNTATRNHD